MTATILFSAPYMLPSLDRFRPVLERHGLDLLVPTVRERLDEDDLLKYAGQFDGAICGDDRYTARVLEACLPRLKVISKWGTGIDSIDSAACARLGIKLCRTTNAFTLPVADTVMGYILAFARRQPWMDRAMRAGVWEKLPARLSECTLGVIGVGNIGKAVAPPRPCLRHDHPRQRYRRDRPGFSWRWACEMPDLHDLLRARFCLRQLRPEPHQPASDQLRTLGFMQPQAVFINTARGPIVDEPALVMRCRQVNRRGSPGCVRGGTPAARPAR